MKRDHCAGWPRIIDRVRPCAPRQRGGYFRTLQPPVVGADHPIMRGAHSNNNLRAFTLVELLITLTVSAVIAATVITMLSATAHGSDSSRTMRELLVRGRVIDGRLRSAIRGSVEVIDHSDDYLVLWTGDTNGDDAKQNDEAQLIERDPSTYELTSYANSADTNGFTTAAAFRSNAKASYPSQRWASGVTTTVIDATNPPAGGAAMVSYRVMIERESATEVIVGAEALRPGQ